jgi:hypothetical protein
MARVVPSGAAGCAAGGLLCMLRIRSPLKRELDSLGSALFAVKRMKHLKRAVWFFVLASVSLAAKDFTIPFKQYKLKNGLTAILSEDHANPSAVQKPSSAAHSQMFFIIGLLGENS